MGIPSAEKMGKLQQNLRHIYTYFGNFGFFIPERMFGSHRFCGILPVRNLDVVFTTNCFETTDLWRVNQPKCAKKKVLSARNQEMGCDVGMSTNEYVSN